MYHLKRPDPKKLFDVGLSFDWLLSKNVSLKLCRQRKSIFSFLLFFGNAHNLCTCWLPDCESGPNCDHDSLSFFEAAKWMLCPANNENRFNCIAFLNHTVHWAQSQPTGRGWNYWKLDATLNRFCSGCLVLPINTDLNALHFLNYAAHWVFIQPTGRRGVKLWKTECNTQQVLFCRNIKAAAAPRPKLLWKDQSRQINVRPTKCRQPNNRVAKYQGSSGYILVIKCWRKYSP